MSLSLLSSKKLNVFSKEKKHTCKRQNLSLWPELKPKLRKFKNLEKLRNLKKHGYTGVWLTRGTLKTSILRLSSDLFEFYGLKSNFFLNGRF